MPYDTEQVGDNVSRQDEVWVNGRLTLQTLTNQQAENNHHASS